MERQNTGCPTNGCQWFAAFMMVATRLEVHRFCSRHPHSVLNLRLLLYTDSASGPSRVSVRVDPSESIYGRAQNLRLVPNA